MALARNSHLIQNLGADRPPVVIEASKLLPLPGPSPQFPEKIVPDFPESEYDCSLDGFSALRLPVHIAPEQKAGLTGAFLSGMRKLLSRDDNWTFWQPLILSLENCVGCQTCSDACPIFQSSGKEEIYRPSYRGEILRFIKQRYLEGTDDPTDTVLTWTLIARLAELAYRCTLCRRCSQVCPMGVDNGLIARELRKLFSQEMGIAPPELHELGTVALIDTPSGCPPEKIENMIETVEEGILEKTGRHTTLPVDKKGADFLFIQTSLESPAWLTCPECFAIVFEKAGLNWTLSSEIGFGGSNFGLWYDDIQFARIVYQQIEIARELGVKKIVLGECGHAYKALAGVADRILGPDMLIPRISWLELLKDIVESGALELIPERNDFAVTLHDPCNVTRQMGMVNSQRRILRKVCRRFREMEPHGVHNYCCGGGSGLILINNGNFRQWRAAIAGRYKVKQILETFQDCLDTRTPKFVCAPCFTCKLELNDLFDFYDVWDRYHIKYGGLIELVVNAMPDVKKPIIDWDSPADNY